MASKKKGTRRGLGKDRKAKFLITLLLRSKVEVLKLLERNEAGAITNAELDRELKRVAANLKRVLDYTSSTLDEVSEHLQRNQDIAMTKGQMNIALRKVVKRLRYICNWSDDLPHRR